MPPTPTDPPALSRRYTPPWVFGVMYGGTFNGFVAVSLSQLLPAHGVTLQRETEIVTLILTASYVGFLFTPIVDCRLPRRVWALLLAGVAATCLAVSIPMLHAASVDDGHGPGAVALMLVLFVGYLANQIYTSAIGGMVPNLVAPSKHGAVSAWMNVSYLALTGLGGEAAVWEVRHLPLVAASLLVPLPVVLGASPLLFMRNEERSLRPFVEAMDASSQTFGLPQSSAATSSRCWSSFCRRRPLRCRTCLAA